MKNNTNIKEVIKKHKSEIIIGLITSALWILIESLIKNAPKVGENILETILNYIYSNASRTSTSKLLAILLSSITGFILGICTVSFLHKYINNKSKNTNEASLKTQKKYKVESITLCVILVLYTVFVFWTFITPISKLSEFERNITMIKPYTNDKTVIMLESDWVRMRSKDDYDKIYETINKIKEENDLPK